MFRFAGLLVGALIFATLFLSLWRVSFPPLPSSLTVDITFPSGIAGEVEPLITTGRTEDADFLAVRYLDAGTAEILYDVWGVGGPKSAPFALRPGERRTLEIAMPTLAHVSHVARRERRPLRVVLDAAPLLDEPVFFHRRAPDEIFFATNPVGGKLVAPRFRGELITSPSAASAPRRLVGGPESYFSAFARLRWLVLQHPFLLLAYVVGSAAAGFVTARLLRLCARIRPPRFTPAPEPPLAPSHPAPPHRWFVATAACATLLFVALLTAGTFRLIAPDVFGNFYDYQARSLLAGRLDLPEAARSSESFIFENRIYIYFGPTPALLRLPFALLEVGLGELTRCYMVAYFLATLAAVYAIQLHVARLAGGPRNYPSPFATIILTATSGLGSTLFFLAARTYVFHEANLCGVTFALWSSYFSLRWLHEPPRRWWLPALLCGLASIHARPPTGLFSLGLLGTTAIALALRALLFRPAAASSAAALLRSLGRPFLIAVAAALAIFSFNGLSYLKFRSFDGAPLRYHVEYQNNDRVSHIQGRNFHASNIRCNLSCYLWHAAPAFSLSFPYINFKRAPVDAYRGARIDLAEPTLSIPYAMPGLAFLGLLGATLAPFRWPAARVPVAVILGAATPMTLALLAAVAISQRYTSDFVPALVLLSALALQSFSFLRPAVRRLLTVLAATLAVLGILVTFAISLHYQGAMVWGIPHDVQQRYASLRKNIDAFFGVANSPPLVPPGSSAPPASAPPPTSSPASPASPPPQSPQSP